MTTPGLRYSPVELPVEGSTAPHSVAELDAIVEERERAGRAAVVALRDALAALARVCVPENDQARTSGVVAPGKK